MKTILARTAAALLFSTSIVAPATAATYTYVGAWSVGDGAYWGDNPAVYSGQQAAAFLFGGVASDYAISTLGEDATLINFRAQVDGWADDTYLFNGGATVAQDYSLDTGGAGYDSNPGFGTAYSALVRDHSDPGQSNTRNYAFRIDSMDGGVPEPATWALMILGMGAVGGAMRRRHAISATVRFA